ncbi:MAG: acetate kinase [Oscillospiraceae bacterium]|nr:acetate kinase [Oscillospiraceae bacterium]
MKILVINAGSSSLKYQVFDMDHESVLCKGTCERIGIADSFMTHKHADGRRKEYRQDMKDHGDAIRLVFQALTDPEIGVVKHMDEIGAVGHRVLHGGEKFTASTVVDEAVKEGIREVIPLGPLHNPANLKGIEACEQAMPGVPQVAVFDTAFHQTMPPRAFMYALPYEYYTKYMVRRYGFHGSSHRYVSAEAARLCGREGDPDFKVVTCHLGNGSSFAAVKGGKCIDTSMGITPLEGIPMGTRSGSLDPAILEYLMDKTGMDIHEMTNVLNKKSGVLGLSGLSSDFRDLEKAQNEGDKRSTLAREVFCYQGRKLIASYAAAMGGVDCVVFTAGVGENDGDVRERMVEGLDFLGIAIDPERDKVRSKVAELSPEGAKVKVLMIPTNEELVIARDTLELVTKSN